MNRTIVLALLIGAASFAHAEENPRLEALTVTVTADAAEADVPLAITRVDVDEQPSPNPQSLQDSLAPVPGLFALNNDNTAQGLRVSIRGFGARADFGVRGIRVLVDGVPLTLPDGQTELDALDLALLDSAQVIRGPSATLFGNAAGGAILLSTRRPATEPEIRLQWQESSFDNHRLRLEGSGRFGDTGLLGSYLNTDIGGFRGHAASESGLFNGKLQRRLGNGELTASISTLDITAQDPGGLTAAQVRADPRAARPENLQFDAGEAIQQQRVALGWDGQGRDWSLQISSYAGQRDFANRLPFTEGGQVTFDRSFGGLGLTASRHLGKHRLSAGLDAQLQSDQRQRFDNRNGRRGAQTLDQREEADSAGIFVRDTLALNDLWETSLGLRYDRLRLTADDDFLNDGNDSGKRSLDDFSADLSLSRQLGKGFIYGRVASSFETPTINELANPGGGGFNPDVESSRAINYELGTRGRWQTLQYTAALYYTRVDDELLPFELASQPGRTFYRNAGKTLRRGLELSARQPLTRYWSLQGNLNLASHKFASGNLDGNDLPGLPDTTARMALHYQRDALHLAGIARHVGRLYADDANDSAVSGHTLLDLQGKWLFRPNWSLGFGIDNLLDKDYNDNIRINAFGGRYFEPAAGRNYRISLNYRWRKYRS